MGPVPSSVGVVAVDFFGHGLVAFAGGVLNSFGVVRLCMLAGFSVQASFAIGFSIAAAQEAGFGTLLGIDASFDEEKGLTGTIQTCDG